MRRAIPLALLLAACSSEPTDDALDDEGGSTTDVDPGGTGGEESDEGGSSSGGTTGEPGEEWPPACVEETPVMDATCSAIRGIVAPGGWSTCGEAVHAMDCEPGAGWTISDVEVALYADPYQGITDPAVVPVVLQTDRLECGGEPITWLNEPYEPGADTPASWRMTWRASYDGGLVYACRRAGEIVPGGVPSSLRGDSSTFCMEPPMGPSETSGPGEPNPLEDVTSCCVESGTPAESSGLPITPCEGA